MEHVCCALCGSDQARRLIVKNGYPVLQCYVCELVYVSPRPTASELAQIYSSLERPLQGAEDSEQKSNVQKFREALRLLRRYWPEPGHLLDVGCSTGIFLQMAKAEGWQVSGIDVGKTVIEYARQRGVDAKCGELKKGTYPPDHFDVVTLFDSIEHMPSPRETLEVVWEITRPGGLILVTTPNISGFVAQTTYRLFGKTIGAWEHPTPPYHIYQFSDRTFTRMLKYTGWKIEELKTRPIPFRYTAGKLENALIDALKKRNGQVNARLFQPWSSDAYNLPVQGSNTQQSYRLRHIARLSVRGFSYALLSALFPIAAMTKRMDSLMVVARKTGLPKSTQIQSGGLT